ncbi:MAG: hypothetical protein ACRERD_07930 [Candidatus Binatia bacterium]
MRYFWDIFMIGLMGAVLFYCGQILLRSETPLNEFRCLFGMSLAVVVIVLKVKAMRAAKAGG